MEQAATEPPRLEALEVRPAPVLELAYAYYHLLRPNRQPSNLPWQRELRERPPKWLQAAVATGERHAGYEALLLACAFGYDADATPERFLTDLPDLPARFLGAFDTLVDAGRYEHDYDPAGGSLAALKESLASLDQEHAHCLAADLGMLWDHLRGAWLESGAETTAAASRALLAALGPDADLVASLPAHHFVSLDDSAAEIRSHQGRGPTLVVPLYFASRGGFKFLVGGRLCIGYGVRSEHLYQEQKDDVVRLANRLKAFSDPTRLLLLFQVARLARFPLTVGDLARQLNVSQPTASGHLRLLRELELVQVVRRGNRSYYRLEREAVKEAVAELERLLLPPL